MAPRSVMKQRSEHRAGVYECVASTAIFSNPGSGEELKNVLQGSQIELTSGTEVSESGHVYAQVEGGGWIMLEKDGGAIVIQKVAVPAVADAAPETTNPTIRMSIRKSFNEPGSPTSPTSSGKYLPSKTSEQIERGRLASISGGMPRSRSPSIENENARRKSSVRIATDEMDAGTQTILAGESSRLAARLGEKSHLENCNREVQAQVDKLSELMQQHLVFRKQQEVNSVRTVRFGE